jgi:hypothetical protein
MFDAAGMPSSPYTSGQVWPSVAAWRAADRRRAASREVWLGSDWYTTRTQPPWRAMWVAATGELVVVQLTGAGEEQHGPVELLAVVPELATLELALRTWPQITGWAGSLPWLRRRAAEL